MMHAKLVCSGQCEMCSDCASYRLSTGAAAEALNITHYTCWSRPQHAQCCWCCVLSATAGSLNG
eukprot:6179539-Pleurochrysis_carterae.AAC.1